ncbi:MAG: hypothetical protein NUW37_15695 [Planctomycetes bacterium]|nr:hypothetical protein [Planctomycetota bacterium]
MPAANSATRNNVNPVMASSARSQKMSVLREPNLLLAYLPAPNETRKKSAQIQNPINQW